MQGKKSQISKEQVLSTLQRLATELGRTPTREELEQMSGISVAVVRKHFTRHRTAVREAGLEPAPTGPPRIIQNQDLLEDWGRVARELNRMPTRPEYKVAGRYAHRCLIDRFQRWGLMPAAFMEAEAKGALRGKWQDVVEMIGSGPDPTRARWARKFMAATRKSGRAPTVLMGPLKPGLPPTLAGMKCVTATMLTVLVASTVLGGGFLRRVLPDRPLLGEPMHTERLTHEPVNEMGVSMLFAMIARDLGFILEAIQPGFPDCRAKMEVMPGRWQDVRIEFEKNSRAFAEHGHDPKGCDMIVCWRHNWRACPKEMMVLELSKAMRMRRSDETS
ncbi:MAG TPA: hypothetical protein VHQ22_18340 [Terriglobales bacterium]|jgi:hypothetical protein|nr:hypothetical protein [Terriglobales bacterium]